MKKDKTYYEQIADEAEYLKWYQTQDKGSYEKPSVTNDSIILAWDNDSLSLNFLAIKRKAHPYRGKFALPGGFVEIDEDIENSVIREVREETNLSLPETRIEQLKTFGSVLRDPRMRIMTVAHLVYLPSYEDKGYSTLDELNAKAGDDAQEVMWLSIRMKKDGQLEVFNGDESLEPNNFAFDHFEILKYGMNRIKNRLNYNPTVLNLLPEYFTATEARLLFSFFEPKLKNVPNSANFVTTYGRFMDETDIQRLANSKGRPPRYYKLKEDYRGHI